jgi:hypothetical protein
MLSIAKLTATLCKSHSKTKYQYISITYKIFTPYALTLSIKNDKLATALATQAQLGAAQRRKAPRDHLKSPF